MTDERLGIKGDGQVVLQLRLRLVPQTVGHLWQQRPPDTYAVHLLHLDPGFGPTKNEIVTKLELSAFEPAIRNDVASEHGTALAEQLDATHFIGMRPLRSFVARISASHVSSLRVRR